MEKRMRDRTWLAAGLCACMLAVCLLAMVCYLWPAFQGFVSAEPPSNVFGMLLIDVLDENAADSYHVNSFGVYVLAVREEGQAEKAGIASGDRLIRVNATPLHSTSQLMDMQETFRPAQKIRLDLQRGHDMHAYAVTLVWNDE